MLRAHKIRMKPSKAQESYFRKACGCRRQAFNWGLARWNELYAAGEKPSALGLKKEYNSVKKELFPWTSEVTKCATEGAFTDLQKAFTNFFKKVAKYPVFKKRGKCRESFKLNNDQFRFIAPKRISVPKLGSVRLYEELRFSGKIMSATVSLRGGRWFISILVETEAPAYSIKSQDRVGVDLGLSCFCQMSTDLNDKVFAPKPLRKKLKCLQRLSRSLSIKEKGSANRKKAATKVAKLHYHISCVREDFLHKLTSKLAKTFEHVAIEDLCVKGMVANRKLSRAVSDVGFFEFRRQLEYKKVLYGGNLVVIDRWFPSTKACSVCGCIKEMSLKDRIYACEHCGSILDRDFNAALNIERQIRA